MRKLKETALVTGGAVRIGQAIAIKLSHIGYSIALHYHSSHKEALQTKKMIQRNNVRCEIFPCDLSNEQEVLALIGRVKKWSSDLNVLVNSASIFEPSNLSDWTFDHYDRHWNTNFKSPLILTSEFARRCKQGQIINILDTGMTKNKTNHLIYFLTKKSLHELTKLAACELAPRIRVNAVAPGAILPPPGKDASYLKKRIQNVPLKKPGDPSQIADCVAFLINNPYITGQVIFNDGGEHLIN